MESYLPTRPASDLHHRLSSRKRPLQAFEAQPHALPEVVGCSRQHSSSFSAIGLSLSRLLPSNRKEKGGTLLQHNDERSAIHHSISLMNPVETLSKRGRSKVVGEERKTKSWSQKTARFIDTRDVDGYRLSRLKKPNAMKWSWELGKIEKTEDGNDGFSQNPDHFHSEARELHRAEEKIGDNVEVVEESPIKRCSSVLDAQESKSSLNRSRQIFNEKKAQREERRSFRESDDFLGVQGVNPRTGYPDISTGTSSSTGDFMSEPTRRKLEEDEKRMKSASREYKDALERRESELRRLEARRENRRKERKERAEKKRMELKARVKREGRWRNEGNRWSMVTEPELSPILQSTAGSPTREAVPPNSEPHRSSTLKEDTIRKEDYFSQRTSPSKTPRSFYKPYTRSTTAPPLHGHDQLHSTEYTFKSPQRSRLPISSGSASGGHPGGPTQAQHITLPIYQKETVSPSIRRRASSSETVVRKTESEQPLSAEVQNNLGPEAVITSPYKTPINDVATPGDKYAIPVTSPSIHERAFLDAPTTLPELKELQGNQASATSYRSASTSQVLNPFPLLQNQMDTSRKDRIPSMTEFPPVVLKDPISARIPSCPRNRQTPVSSQVMNSAPIFRQQDLKSHGLDIITHITTTTGFVVPPCSLSQLDGSKDANKARVSPQHLIATNRRNLTPHLHLKDMPNCTPNIGSQMKQAGIATSSAHHPPAFATPTRRPIRRLCQPVSLEPERVGLKSTPTSTSTFPQQQSLLRHYTLEQKAAQVAFSNVRPQRYVSPRLLGKKVMGRSSSLTSPKTRAKQEGPSYGGREMFSRGNVDIGGPFRTPEELEIKAQLSRKRIEQAKTLSGSSRDRGENAFIVWSAEPERESRVSDEEVHTGKEVQSLPSKKLMGPSKGMAGISLLWKTYNLVKETVRAAWWFVSPVFNPRSSLRWRWVRNRLTWQDVLLIGAAGIFGGGAFLVMVLCARLLGLVLQIAKVTITVYRILAGL